MTVRVLVIAEHDGRAPAKATLGTLGAAAALDPEVIDVAVLSADGDPVASILAGYAGIGRILKLDRPENWPALAAVWAPQIAALAASYTHLLAPATTFGKDLLPRVAALLDTGLLSDIVGIDGAASFRRPIYAGNAIVRVEAESRSIICATIRPSAFPEPEAGGQVPIEPASADAELPTHTRFVARHGGGGQGPDLQTARRVVAGGRGLGGPENFELVRALARSLDAAIGASRAAVDAGWVTNDLQVGQTGKIIAPDLYIGIGISGAIQHLTGIKDAGTIVAINTDPDAPICGLADYVLIEDLRTAVPALIAELDAMRNAGQAAGS